MLATDQDFEELGLKRGEVRVLASALSTHFGPKQVQVTVAPSAMDTYRQEEEEEKRKAAVASSRTSNSNIDQPIPSAPVLTVGSGSDTSAESISTLDSGNSGSSNGDGESGKRGVGSSIDTGSSGGENANSTRNGTDVRIGDTTTSSNNSTGGGVTATVLSQQDGKGNQPPSSSSSSTSSSYGNAKELLWSELKVGDVVGEGSFGQVNESHAAHVIFHIAR
jgi:hypothetical protein